MKIREDILNELKTISTVVADVPYLNVYTSNADYFGGIAADIKARIDTDTLPGSQNNFAVPTGYFENLTASILQKIKGVENEIFAETKKYSTIIAAVGNKNIYTVPQQYFEELGFENKEKPVGKVIKLNRTRSIFKYAAAAAIAGLLGITIINILYKSEVSLADKGSTQIAATIKTADNIIKIASFDKELESIPDEDIEKYLQQSGQDVNAALVAAITDDAYNLPEAADYLVDENTLDNYLNENNLKN